MGEGKEKEEDVVRDDQSFITSLTEDMAKMEESNYKKLI